VAQLMPLPLTVSCFSKIQIGFYLSVTGSPVLSRQDKEPLIVCVCVHVQKYFKSVDAGTSTAAAAAVAPVSPANTVSPVAGLSEVQQQMVQQFSVQSGMNASWSARYGSSRVIQLLSSAFNAVTLWVCVRTSIWCIKVE